MAGGKILSARPNRNHGLGVLRFLESLPLLGHLMALIIFCLRRTRGEAARVAIWASFGLIPGLNVWRWIVICYRHRWLGIGPRLPSDCSACSRNDSLHDDEAWLGPQDLRWVNAGTLRLSAWMRCEDLRRRSLFQLCLPGSHDSASYRTHYARGIAAAWAFTHGAHDSVFQQLNNGVRWLDFRIVDVEIGKLYDSCMGWKNPRKICRLWTSHTLLCVPMTEVVRDIARFLQQMESREEVVVATLVQAAANGHPQMTADSWLALLGMFEDALGEEAMLVREELHLSLDELCERGKRLCLIARGCPVSDRQRPSAGGQRRLVAYEDFVEQSWATTQASCPSALQQNSYDWLLDKQEGIRAAKKFYWLNCELTPPAWMIADSMLYVSLTGDNYLLLEDCCLHAQRVMREGFGRRWKGLRLSVVTCDFCSRETSMWCIAQNFDKLRRDSALREMQASISSSP